MVLLLLCYELHIVSGSSVFIFVLLCITFCPFWFWDYYEEEENDGSFACIILQMYCFYECFVALPYGFVDGQLYVIAVFPDHTHSRFVVKNLPMFRYSVDIFSYSGPSGTLGSNRSSIPLKPMLGGLENCCPFH